MLHSTYSTPSVCPYTTTVTPCPTAHSKSACVISTSSTSMTTYTTKVLVPISSSKPSPATHEPSVQIPSILPCSIPKATGNPSEGPSAFLPAGSSYSTVSAIAGGNSTFGPLTSPSKTVGYGANLSASTSEPVAQYTGEAERLMRSTWMWMVLVGVLAVGAL